MYGIHWTTRSRRFAYIATLKARSVGFVKVGRLWLGEDRKAKADSEKECEECHTFDDGCERVC